MKMNESILIRMRPIVIFLLLFGISSFSSLRAESFFNPGGSVIEKGWEKFQSEDYSGALDEFQNAEKNFPNDPRLSFNRGSTLLKGGRPKEAIPHFEKSLDVPNPSKRAEAYFNMGKAYSELGDKKKSLDSYRKALEENPTMEEAKKNIELLFKNPSGSSRGSASPKPNPNNQSNSDPSQNQSEQQSQDADRNKEPSLNRDGDNRGTGNETKDQNKDNGEKEDKKNSEDTNPKTGEDKSKSNKGERNKPGQKEGTLSPEDAEDIMDSLNPEGIKRQKGKSILQPRRDKFW